MKLGADKPWKTGLAIALMAISLVLALRTFLMPVALPAAQTASTSGTSAAASGQRRRTTVRGRAGAVLVASADPRLRLDLLKASEDVPYTGAERNIFRAEAELPKVVAPPIDPRPNLPPAPPQVYTPPAPPPINLRFFGFSNRPGEPKKVFLAEGDSVYVAGEGEIVARRYKVLHIGNTTVEIQDVVNNRTQTIALTQS